MGYMSSVFFEIPSDHYQEFLSRVREHCAGAHKCDTEMRFREAEDLLNAMHQTQFPNHPFVFFHDYIKWHESDTVCSAIELAASEIEHTSFVRSGEERDDVEIFDPIGGPWLSNHSISCEATVDALNTACYFLSNMELAGPVVRLVAIRRLQEIVDKLKEA